MFGAEFFAFIFFRGVNFSVVFWCPSCLWRGFLALVAIRTSLVFLSYFGAPAFLSFCELCTFLNAFSGTIRTGLTSLGKFRATDKRTPTTRHSIPSNDVFRNRVVHRRRALCPYPRAQPEPKKWPCSSHQLGTLAAKNTTL